MHVSCSRAVSAALRLAAGAPQALSCKRRFPHLEWIRVGIPSSQINWGAGHSAHTKSEGSLWIQSWLRPEQREARLGALKEATEVAGRDGYRGRVVVNLNQLCDNGLLKEALDAVDSLGEEEICVSSYVLNRMLRLCILKKDLAAGKRVHFYLLKYGLQSSSSMGNLLIELYSTCGDMQGATEAFYQLASPTADTWRCMIAAHVRARRDEHALQLYQEMKRSKVAPDAHVYVAALKACASLAVIDMGRNVHVDITASGYEANMFVGSALVAMYLKCGSLEDARKVFCKLPKLDLVCCNLLIAGYAENGCGPDALNLFGEMLQAGVKPDNGTFVSVLKALGHIAALDQARMIHTNLIELGLTLNVAVANSLIDMYIKCGSLDDARRVFEDASMGDVVSRNLIMASCLKKEHTQQELQLFATMADEGPKPNRTTCLIPLDACDSFGELEQDSGFLVEMANRSQQAKASTR